MLGKDPRVLGFNVGINSGKVAGQTVMHYHILLIPRRAGKAGHLERASVGSM